MPGAQPKRDWWTRVSSQLARQSLGTGGPGSAKT